MAKKKEPVVQAEIVEAFARMLADAAPEETPETAGGYLTLTETHIIFLEALEISQAEKAKEVRTTFETLNNLLQSLKERAGAEKEKVYGSKELDKLTITDEEETKRLYALAERVNELIDEGKEQYIKLYAADKERIKADAARAILAETFEDFSIFRAYEIIAYTNKKKAKNEAAKTEQKKAAARIYDAFKMFDYYIQEHIAGTFFKVWEINNQGKDALKEWEENTQGAKDRLYKEWLEKVPKAELEGIGLLKKDKKSEKGEASEQVERVPILNKPDKLKILVSSVKDNLIQSNLDFLKLPVDAQQTFFMEEGEKGRGIEERPAKFKNKYGRTEIDKPIYSRVYMTTEKGVTLDKELLKVDDTDLTIFTHVLTLLAYGNYEMTAEQIYQQMTREQKRALPKKWADRIDLFFRRFSSRRFGIIYDELVRAGMIPETKENKMYLKKGSWEEQLLVYGKEKYINKQGKESYKYIIRDMPFIYVYSEWRDLIISVDIDLLTAGAGEKNNTEEVINIRHYLLMRIGKAKRKKAKKTLTASDTTILIDTLINKSLSPFEIIDQGNGKPRQIKAVEITRQKKSETLDTVRAILEDLKQRGEIKGYSRPREEKGRGGRYEKILFEL